MNNKEKHLNWALLTLVSTAVFMLGMLAGKSSDTPAVAATSSSDGGGYILTSAQHGNDESLLYVIDNSTQRLNVYLTERRSGDYQIVLKETMNLGRIVERIQERLGDDDE